MSGCGRSTVCAQQPYASFRRINFINSLNPNGNAASAFTPLVARTLNLTTWPTYTTSTAGGNKNMLRLKSGNLTVFQDTYRDSAMQYINSIPEALDH